MYNLTRQETADKLSISTRSVDRYIKSWKLRSRKEWKIIYIHADDVRNLTWEPYENGPKVIIEPTKKSYSEQSTVKQTQASQEVATPWSHATLEKIYLDLRSEIKSKDKAIQDLSIRLWQAQEIAKNSVSLVEFKKSQFLLEESKGYLSWENTALKEKAEELGQKLKYEKTTNYLLIGFCVILVLALWLLWFVKI